MANDHLYLCDIHGNTECSKEGCIINGGPCMMTKNREFGYKPWRLYRPKDLMDWAVDMFDNPSH